MPIPIRGCLNGGGNIRESSSSSSMFSESDDGLEEEHEYTEDAAGEGERARFIFSYVSKKRTKIYFLIDQQCI